MINPRAAEQRSLINDNVITAKGTEYLENVNSSQCRNGLRVQIIITD